VEVFLGSDGTEKCSSTRGGYEGVLLGRWVGPGLAAEVGHLLAAGLLGSRSGALQGSRHGDGPREGLGDSVRGWAHGSSAVRMGRRRGWPGAFRFCEGVGCGTSRFGSRVGEELGSGGVEAGGEV